MLRLSEALAENPGGRLDSDYFAKRALTVVARITAQKNEPLGQLVERVQHPMELERIYSDAGIEIVLAQHIRDNRIEIVEPAFMPASAEPILRDNRIENGDVVMTRSGANYGQSATWLDSRPVYACADLLVLRRPSCPSGYLSSFLASAPGNLLLDRGSYGAAQPHIAPTYLVGLRIPRFGKLEASIDQLVRQSAVLARDCIKRLTESEATLAAALGLGNWQPPEPLTYIRRASEAFAAGRLDAQYFTPRVAELLTRLGKSGRTVRDVAPPRSEKFAAVGAGHFRYIEISDVRNDGTATSETIPISEAPSRATSHVRAGDVLTSTVRPNRRLSALILPEQDGCVASSGFVVLTPQAVPAEVLLTYLRLPLFCELMDLHTSASLYPAISDRDLLALPFPTIPTKAGNTIVAAVRSAHTARQRAQALLAAAQRAVEIAIGESEAAALAHLRQHSETQSVSAKEM